MKPFASNRKLLLILFVVLLGGVLLWLMVLPRTEAHKTYYIRPGGGADRTVANGLTDVDCSPATGPNCAFNSPSLLFFPGNSYNTDYQIILQSGDTVIIHQGHYGCGYGGPNSGDAGGSAVPGDPYRPCYSRIPAGVTFKGDGVNSTQIYGRYGAGAIFDLSGASGVTLSDLELTDHEQCSRMGLGDGHPCSSSYPLSNFAQNGITTNNQTGNLTLTNLNIHGFTSRGILGPIGGTVTATNVRIAYNGGAGWDFDDGHGTASVNGAVKASYLVVEWNGCNEEYPVVHKTSARWCSDQDNGGYGDGIGTPGTPLNFTCDHCIFRYNTQDGLDLLHVNGSLISITHSESYGNMGQQWKTGAMEKVLFENNLTVHNCARLSAPVGDSPAGFNAHLSLFCRASGDGITFYVVDNGTYIFHQNSFAGYGSTSYDIGCGAPSCTKPVIFFENNLHIGYASPFDGQLPGIFYFQNLPHSPFAASDHNIYFHMRSCPAETNSSCDDPKVKHQPSTAKPESNLDALDFHLTTASSNAIARGAATGVMTDFEGHAQTAPPSIGAFSGASLGAPIPPEQPPTFPAQQWSAPIAEHSTVHGLAGQTFRYGHDAGISDCDHTTQLPGGWIEKTLMADTTFVVGVEFFGGDPAYCQMKHGELKLYTVVPH